MANKQTAIQIAIESYQNDGVSFTDWFMDNSSMLLAMEKEQIMKANYDGFVEGISVEDNDSVIISNEQYYNENYGK